MREITVNTLNESSEHIPEAERFDEQGNAYTWQWFAVIDEENDKVTVLRQRGYSYFDFNPELDNAKMKFQPNKEIEFIESFPHNQFFDKYPVLCNLYLSVK